MKQKQAAEKKRLNDQKHRRFKQGLTPAPSERLSNRPRCPPGLAQKILTAGKAGYAKYFAVYASEEVNENWAEMEFRVNIKEAKREEQLHGKSWFTKADLLEKHHQDQAFVNSIVERKTKVGEWTPRPDEPISVDHRLYYCFDFMRGQRAKEREASKEHEFRKSLGQEAAAALQGSIQDVHFTSATESSSSLAPVPAPPQFVTRQRHISK